MFHVKQQWREWVEAWRTLPDNPIAHYFRLAERRRYQSLSWSRRGTRFVVLLLPLAIFAYMFLEGSLGLLFGMPTWNIPPSLLDLAGLILIPVAVTGVIWLLLVLFDAVRDSMGILADPARRNNSMQIDELTLLTPLTPHEMTLGSLSVVARPLLRTTIVCCLILLLYSIYSAALRQEQLSWIFFQPGPTSAVAPNVAQRLLGKIAAVPSIDNFADLGQYLGVHFPLLTTLAQLPFTLAMTLLHGYLVAMILLLLFFTLGRGLAGGPLGLAPAMFMVAAQPLLMFVFPYAANMGDLNFAMEFREAYWVRILALLLVPVGLATLLGAVRFSSRQRAAVATALPCSGYLALFIAFALSLIIYLIVPSGGAVSTFQINVNWLGLFHDVHRWQALFQPLTLFKNDSWSILYFSGEYQTSRLVFHAVLQPLILLVDLALLIVLLQAAVDSVRLRKQGI